MDGKTRGALGGSVALLCLGLAAWGAPPRREAKTSDLHQLGKASRTQLVQQLNKQVTVEGYFYDGSIPLIVDKMERLQADSPMPEDAYIVLAGEVPSSFRSGAKVKLRARVQEPTSQELKQEKVVLRVPRAAQHAVLQAAPEPTLRPLQTARLPSSAIPVPPSKRYALLIGGGMNAANNHARYWNELRAMWWTMFRAGYAPGRIVVVYANGRPRVFGSIMPVHYSATIPGIEAAFSWLADRMQPEDELYIMVTGQGSRVGAGAVSQYYLWNGMPIPPFVFAHQVDRIKDYRRMVIQMNQSYSGGFIPALRNPRRVIITAAAADREAYCHPTHAYGNFSYWYLSGLAGHQLGTESPWDADADRDGHVSVVEAYNQVLSAPHFVGRATLGEWQLPQLEDTGTEPSQSRILPADGEGILAAAIYM